MEIEIKQSTVRPDIWFLYIDKNSIQLTEEQVIEIARAVMKTSIGKEMLDNYTKKLRK